MKQEMSYLNKKVKTLNEEKDFLIDNFKITSGILLDRLKDLEAQNDPLQFGHERPQTSNVLSKICKSS
jgi:hypothetical protein